MAFRVRVDHDKCSSIGVCMQHAPQVFEVGDDNLLYLLDENPPDELRQRVEASAIECPMQAITIEVI
ncbi:MAG: ferredoxin [Thermoleophilia bacterium]|nr:ferredoxin [Thermoleophilia bacterium]